MDGQDINSRIQAQLRPQLPKRFYQNAAIEQCGGGFAVMLDGRKVKTRARQVLVLPREKLAAMVADEWQEQLEFINPATMPLTRLANTAIDLVGADPGPAINEITGFAASDLICYRAQDPAGLVKRQCELWDPVLLILRQKLGVRFKTACGIRHVEQPPEALAIIAQWLAGRGPFAIAALHSMSTLTGSALLTWALGEGELTAQETWQAAHIDENWQSEQWGRDAEAAMRMDTRKKEYEAAVDFLRNC